MAAPTTQPDTTAPLPEIDPGGTPGTSKWSRSRAEGFLKSCARRAVYVRGTGDEEAHELRTGEPVYRWVGWNGWSWAIPVGRSVEVPEPIAQIIDQSQEMLRTSQAKEQRTVMPPLNDGEQGVKLQM